MSFFVLIFGVVVIFFRIMFVVVHLFFLQCRYFYKEKSERRVEAMCYSMTPIKCPGIPADPQHLETTEVMFPFL